jgi:plastocyanin
MWPKIGALLLTATAVALGLRGGADVQAGGGCHEIPYGVNESTTTTVSIEECKYLPTVVRIDAGDSVQWTNNDNLLHTVTGVADSWGDFKEYEEGGTVSFKFAADGVFPYFCELHPGMVGAVVVGDGVGAATNSGGGVSAISAIAPGSGEREAAAPNEGSNGEFGAGSVALIGVAAAVAGAVVVVAGFTLVRRTRGV